jgi:hypothetical protein
MSPHCAVINVTGLAITITPFVFSLFIVSLKNSSWNLFLNCFACFYYSKIIPFPPAFLPGYGNFFRRTAAGSNGRSAPGFLPFAIQFCPRGNKPILSYFIV